MQTRTFVCLFLALAMTATAAFGKDGNIGIYAMIDKVELRPDASNPQSIQVWGTFIVPVRRSSGLRQAPQKGYVYYTLPSANIQAVQKEWTELKRLEKTGQPVGVADYWMNSPRTPGGFTALEVQVHQPGEVALPAPYPLMIGILKNQDARNPNFNKFVAQLKSGK